MNEKKLLIGKLYARNRKMRFPGYSYLLTVLKFPVIKFASCIYYMSYICLTAFTSNVIDL